VGQALVEDGGQVILAEPMEDDDGVRPAEKARAPERLGRPAAKIEDLLIDLIIDPTETRAVVGLALSAALNAPVGGSPWPVHRM
jgi:acetyl-CoA carboxylase carboxyltransferase component